jgi:hypothetical protein
MTPPSNTNVTELAAEAGSELCIVGSVTKSIHKATHGTATGSCDAVGVLSQSLGKIKRVFQSIGRCKEFRRTDRHVAVRRLDQ